MYKGHTEKINNLMPYRTARHITPSNIAHVKVTISIYYNNNDQFEFSQAPNMPYTT